MIRRRQTQIVAWSALTAAATYLAASVGLMLAGLSEPVAIIAAGLVSLVVFFGLVCVGER